MELAPGNSVCVSLHSTQETHPQVMSSDSVVLAVVKRRWAEGERAFTGQTVERSEHAVGHVICKHPGADHNTPECHFIGPICTIPDLVKTGSEGKILKLFVNDGWMDDYFRSIIYCLFKKKVSLLFHCTTSGFDYHISLCNSTALICVQSYITLCLCQDLVLMMWDCCITFSAVHPKDSQCQSMCQNYVSCSLNHTI